MYLLNDGTYREYEMIIYNRWGEEVFAPMMCKQDGTEL